MRGYAPDRPQRVGRESEMKAVGTMAAAIGSTMVLVAGVTTIMWLIHQVIR